MTDNQIMAATAAIVAVAKKHHLTMMASTAEIQTLANEAALAAIAAYEANAPDEVK